jgi:uncharacterized membrane protein YgaE (UPF0421/DUF939 family)
MLAALTFIRTIPAWAWYGIAVVAAIISFLIYSDHIRDEAVEQDRADTRARVTETVLDAERKANRNDERRRVEREAQTQELEQARDEADPAATRQPVGPAVRAVLNRLREQQQTHSPPAP